MLHVPKGRVCSLGLCQSFHIQILICHFVDNSLNDAGHNIKYDYDKNYEEWERGKIETS